MPKRDPDLLLQDMIECCSNIFKYTEGMTFDSFIHDKKTVDAVIRNFEVLGEASKRLPTDLKAANIEIEWKKIIDLRNVLIHDYFGVNHQILWNIIQQYLPKQFELLKLLFGNL